MEHSSTDTLQPLYAAHESNIANIDALAASVAASNKYEKQILASSMESISLVDFERYEAVSQPAEKILALKSSFMLPAIEALTDARARRYSHSLAVESVSARIKTMSQALGRLGRRVLQWLTTIIERVNEVIEGTYKRARKARELIAASRRSIHQYELTNSKYLALFANGPRLTTTAELEALPGLLSRLVTASFEDAQYYVSGFRKLFADPKLTRDDVFNERTRKKAIDLLAKSISEGENTIVYGFNFGLHGNRIQIRRAKVSESDFDPQGFGARIVSVDNRKPPSKALTLTADQAINVCTNIMDVITQVRESRKQFASLEKGVKEILKHAEKPEVTDVTEYADRRLDMISINKLLMSELGTVYKFVFMQTRDLMDFVDLLLKPEASLDSRKRRAKLQRSDKRHVNRTLR